MEKQKLFIPAIMISKAGGKTVTLISANKIKELEEFLPSKEALETHMQIQHLMTQKDSKYRPQPLAIKVERVKFNKAIEKVKAKNPNVDSNCIPLVLQYPAVPIAIIEPGD